MFLFNNSPFGATVTYFLLSYSDIELNLSCSPLANSLPFKHVILGDNAKLNAQGADAVQDVSDSSPRGGGGGGVIAIYYKEGLVGRCPTPDVDTKGGSGTTSGDNGLVVLNGMEL